jgi:hypothetical protein
MEIRFYASHPTVPDFGAIDFMPPATILQDVISTSAKLNVVIVQLPGKVITLLELTLPISVGL